MKRKGVNCYAKCRKMMHVLFIIIMKGNGKKDGICMFEYDNENGTVEHRDHLRHSTGSNRLPTIIH